MWGRGMRLRGGPERAVQGQGCVGGPLEMRWAHRLPRLPPGVCMCVCVHAPSLQPSPAEPFKNLHMQKTLIPGAFPWLRGVFALGRR